MSNEKILVNKINVLFYINNRERRKSIPYRNNLLILNWHCEQKITN